MFRKYAFILICAFTITGIILGCSNIPPVTSTVTSPVTSTKTITLSSTSANSQVSEILEVYYLDVGQGDAEILRIGNDAMLIDAGTNESTNTLLADIKNLGITSFDYVIGTHPHEDHIGGMDAIINQFGVESVLMPDVTSATQTYKDVMAAVQKKNLSVNHAVSGSHFNMGPVTFSVLAPNSSSYSDLNNYSIVLQATYGNESFLFTGDAQNVSEAEILSKGYNIKSDVLKVGHHGSSTSTSADFLKAVTPTYAVIEVGQENSYGHPTKQTLDKLKAAEVTVYRTDQNGIIEIKSDGKDLKVTPAKVRTSR